MNYYEGEREKNETQGILYMYLRQSTLCMVNILIYCLVISLIKEFQYIQT